jgi:hypothetical protein
LIWTHNGIISILVINYIMIASDKLWPKYIGILHYIKTVQSLQYKILSQVNYFFQWEKNTQTICSTVISIKFNSILVLGHKLIKIN